jgi:anti-sigma factor RsiW
MRDLTARLGDAESVLLLYLAGELSADERSRVDEALANDAGLRDVVVRLRAMLDECDRALTRLDDADFGGQAMRLDRQAAVDARASEVVRNWIAQPRAAAEPLRRRTRDAPVWTYPFAAAAAILLGFLIYWGRAPVGNPVVAHQDMSPTTAPADDLAAADVATPVTAMLFPTTNPGTDLNQVMAWADDFNDMQSLGSSATEPPVAPDAPAQVNP